MACIRLVHTGTFLNTSHSFKLLPFLSYNHVRFKPAHDFSSCANELVIFFFVRNKKTSAARIEHTEAQVTAYGNYQVCQLAEN